MSDYFVALTKVFDLGADSFDDSGAVRAGDEIFVAEFQSEAALCGSQPVKLLSCGASNGHTFAITSSRWFSEAP